MTLVWLLEVRKEYGARLGAGPWACPYLSPRGCSQYTADQKIFKVRWLPQMDDHPIPVQLGSVSGVDAPMGMGQANYETLKLNTKFINQRFSCFWMYRKWSNLLKDFWLYRKWSNLLKEFLLYRKWSDLLKEYGTCVVFLYHNQ